MAAPILIKQISPQIVNEQATFGPLNLQEFIDTQGGQFQAGTKTGESLPAGLICTGDGIITGIPSKGTTGVYEVVLTVQNAEGSLTQEFIFTIKPSLATAGNPEYFDTLKTQVWQALDQKLPLPELGELLNRPITALDIYYLLERWGMLTAWDAFNLEPASSKILLNLEGVSPHYNVYDRGSSIVACPKDLFSHERTLADGLQTARAVAREVFKRNWTVELAGLDKLTRAAWIEIQRLGDQYGKRLDIINYDPSPHDVLLYASMTSSQNRPGYD